MKELRPFAPYRVLEQLVDSLKGRWDDAAQACARDVAEQLQGLADKLVADQFGQFDAAQSAIR